MVLRKRKTLEEQSDLADRLPLYKRAFWVYAMVFGGAGGAIIWADEHWPKVGWLQRNGANFGADFAGLAITLLLIDRVVAWRRDADLHPLCQSAVRRLGKAMRDLEIQMAWLFKAASAPQVEPPTIGALVDGFLSAVARLDFEAESPTSGCAWKVFLPQRFDQIAINLDRAVTRHEEVLPPQLAAAIDSVIDDGSFQLFRNGEALATALALVPPGGLLPQAAEFGHALKTMYAEYAEFRGRPYHLVAWEIPREWATALRSDP